MRGVNAFSIYAQGKQGRSRWSVCREGLVTVSGCITEPNHGEE